MPYQKSVQEYRRDIFALKNKLKEQNQLLEDLKQKYSDIDIFDEKSYSFGVKLKIHEYNLNAIKQQMHKFLMDQAADYYSLNFATLALVKASDIFSINREMIFRAVDIEATGEVNWFQFSNFLKQTLRMNTEFVQPILKVLDPHNQGKVSKSRYIFYLQVFMINSEQQKKVVTTLDDCCASIARQMQVDKIDPNKIWRAKQLTVAMLCHGLKKKLKGLDPLQAVGMYCKLDPLKKGFVQTNGVVQFLEYKLGEAKNYQQKGIKLQK